MPNNATSPIAVAVSGGADSLAVLALLRKTMPNRSLVAVHGLFGQEVMHDFLVSCGLKHGPWPDAAHQAMLEQMEGMTAALGIPLHVLDLSQQFFSQVVRPFVAQYVMGLTPNPCALCNRAIKFGALLEACRSLGASHLATGHYARLENGTLPCPDLRLAGLNLGQSSRPGSAKASISPELPTLKPGVDSGKDQSYFLALVPGQQLEQALFPLGNARKSDVLRFLQDHNLTPPQPGESQEICFIPGGRTGAMPGYRDFIPFMASRLGIPLPGPGPICLDNGQVLGRHRGLWHYTEGQRKGLGIGWKEPLHVLAKNVETNTLLLGPQHSMGTNRLLAGPANILAAPQYWPETVLVKTRYREAPRQAKVHLVAHSGETCPPSTPVASMSSLDTAGVFLDVSFLEPEKTVAPGQLVAVYAPDGEDLRLLAGGIISHYQPL